MHSRRGGINGSSFVEEEELFSFQVTSYRSSFPPLFSSGRIALRTVVTMPAVVCKCILYTNYTGFKVFMYAERRDILLLCMVCFSSSSSSSSFWWYAYATTDVKMTLGERRAREQSRDRALRALSIPGRDEDIVVRGQDGEKKKRERERWWWDSIVVVVVSSFMA